MTMQAEQVALETAQNANVIENSALLASINFGAIVDYLSSFGVGQEIIGFLVTAVTSISSIFNRSGVQIFIFLAGLSSIPDSMYEAASMEGATGWECFWKITFPMTTSIIVVNFVYSVVDSFNSMLSPMLQYINDEGLKGGSYGYGSAMSVIYFLIVAVAVGLIVFTTRKRVFYYV